MARTDQWKNVERAISKLFGGERNPITGRMRSSSVADLTVTEGIFSHLSFEVKHRNKFPSWIMEDAFDQADQSGRGERHSIVILHEKGQRYEDSFILMRAGDFIDYSKRIAGEKDGLLNSKETT